MALHDPGRARTRAALLPAAGRPADRDQALTFIDRNLSNDPESAEDLPLKVSILEARSVRRCQAVAILERLAATSRLADQPRFLPRWPATLRCR
jgi:hypothetical protein